MTQIIRQGATHKVVIGPAVAVGDGFTPVTTLALTTADEAEAILHDNGTVVSISAYTWAAITTADGYYHLTLQSGISNTVGHLTIVINDDSLCLPIWKEFTVMDTAAYDAMYADGAEGPLQATTVGRKLDVTATGAAGIDWANVENPTTALNLSGTNIDVDQVVASVSGAVGSVTGAVGSVTGAVGSVTAEVTADAVKFGGAAVTATTSVTIPASSTLATTTGAVGSVTGAVGSVTGDTKQTADVAALITTVGVAGAGLTNLGGSGNDWNTVVPDVAGTAATPAEVAAELATYDGPTNTEMVAAFTEIKGATWATTDSLEAIRDRGDAAWTTGAGGTPPTTLQNTTIATLASQTSFTLTAGSADADAYNNQMIIITDSATSTQKAVGLISDYAVTTKTVTLAADPGIFTMAVGDTVDIVAVTGSAVGLQVDATGYALLPTATQASIDAIETDTSTTLQAELDAIQAAVITNAAGVDIAADIIAMKAETALIVADTGELQTDWADGGRLDVIQDAIKVVTDALTSGGATNLALSAAGIIGGVAATGTLSTTVCTSDLSGYLDDELINRVIVFTGGTADGQAATITDYAATNGTVTFSGGITTAPANADTFVIV